MATLVSFHAHPDDESITTAGLLARAAAAGHRVVLVVATRGEHGGAVPGSLGEGEQLGIRRVAETFESAEVLGVHRVEFLGYVDSGMAGSPTNRAPYAFCSADVRAAARRLAEILVEEAADVLTIYDPNGGYGHPDHIQVHRVGSLAAELAGTPGVFEATMNRDAIARLRAAVLASSPEDPSLAEAADVSAMGTPERAITHAVEVGELIELKRRSMTAHASQIAEDSFFLQMPPEVFATAFGTEWYVRHGSAHRRGPEGVFLLPGLA